MYAGRLRPRRRGRRGLEVARWPVSWAGETASKKFADLVGAWTLLREADRCVLYEGASADAGTVVRATADAA